MPPFENAFLYVDSYGLPLYMVMQDCSEKGQPVDLSAFFSDAAKAGWSIEKTTAVVEECLVELGREHVNFVIENKLSST